MTRTMDDFHFGRLLKMVFNRIGLDCTHYKTSYLKRRLAVRMRATKVKTYKDYERLLTTDDNEYDLLLDRLTINVSQFFRDISVFQEIKRVIIPRLKQKKHIKIWSAGCANGEEPYSLAMMFDHELSPAVSWEIMATDLDPSCLERAGKAEYKSQAVADVPPEYKKRYLEKKDELWHVKPHLKAGIKFKIHDLTGAMPIDRFDIIFCRNVLIYFMPVLQESLFAGFKKILAPDGYLILGKTETLLGDIRNAYSSINGRERIYQVKSGQQGSEEKPLG